MKCRYCKKEVYPDEVEYDFVKYIRTEPARTPKGDPDHESVVVVFARKVLHRICGHVAGRGYIGVRVVHDGQGPRCWIVWPYWSIDLKEHERRANV